MESNDRLTPATDDYATAGDVSPRPAYQPPVMREPAEMPASPLAGHLDNINQGVVAIEASRAIAEAQGKLVIAKRFPRDEVRAYAAMRQACSRKGIAEKAFFSFPRAGQTVSGPTIRLAEELARCWGNLDYGIKELSQDVGKSEMQAYAWDMETNTISTQNFVNPHVREVGRRVVQLDSARDIYEVNANMAARRLRARILAILPADFVDAAIEQCRATLAGRSDEPLIDRVKKMVVTFAKVGVSQAMLERRLKHGVEEMTPDDLADYVGIYNALRGGESKVADWFEGERTASDVTAAFKGAETLS